MLPPPLPLLRSPSSLTRHFLRPLLRQQQQQYFYSHSLIPHHNLRLHLHTQIPQSLSFSTSSNLSRNRSFQCAAGTTTPVPEPSSNPDSSQPAKKKPPFYFEAGYALYAKRPSRPFPPPFLSYPSGSFSDPLSTHHKSRDRRQQQPTVGGEMIRGVTNGDDAVVVGENYVGANDGVGAWATKERGHAALWSRLILHFWSLQIESADLSHPNTLTPIQYLQTAFEKTQEATSSPNEWYGTTTTCACLLTSSSSNSNSHSNPHPTLHITQLGDSQILVLRPSLLPRPRPKTTPLEAAIIFKTKEQWHWFDCPRQLGTNSPDTPQKDAVLDTVEVQEDDIVVAMTDGVIDNLWEHEVVSTVLDALERWEEGGGGGKEVDGDGEEMEKKDGGEGGKMPAERTYAEGMQYVAQELLNAARRIAEDPFAESPYMEKAIDEGLSIEGGKLDDISVVVAQCKRRKG